MSDNCKKARKRAIPFDCKFDAGHEGECSPYTLPPSGNWLTHGFTPPRPGVFPAGSENEEG